MGRRRQSKSKSKKESSTTTTSAASSSQDHFFHLIQSIIKLTKRRRRRRQQQQQQQSNQQINARDKFIQSLTDFINAIESYNKCYNTFDKNSTTTTPQLLQQPNSNNHDLLLLTIERNASILRTVSCPSYLDELKSHRDDMSRIYHDAVRLSRQLQQQQVEESKDDEHSEVFTITEGLMMARELSHHFNSIIDFERFVIRRTLEMINHWDDELLSFVSSSTPQTMMVGFDGGFSEGVSLSSSSSLALLKTWKDALECNVKMIDCSSDDDDVMDEDFLEDASLRVQRTIEALSDYGNRGRGQQLERAVSSAVNEDGSPDEMMMIAKNEDDKQPQSTATTAVVSDNEGRRQEGHDYGWYNNSSSSLSSRSIGDVVNDFCCHHRKNNNSTSSSSKMFYLVMGAAGTGKTFTCRAIQQRVTKMVMTNEDDDGIIVIQPSLPVDILGSTVGSSEKAIINIFIQTFNHYYNTNKKCILLLDNLEHIVGGGGDDGQTIVDNDNDDDDNNNQQRELASSLSHRQKRLQYTFLSLVEDAKCRCRRHTNSGNDSRAGGVLVICTATSIRHDIANVFDEIFILKPSPNERSRRRLIISCLQLQNDKKCNDAGASATTVAAAAALSHDDYDTTPQLLDDNSDEALLRQIIENTVGQSPGEIARYCRETLIIMEEERQKRNMNNSSGFDIKKQQQEQQMTTTSSSIRSQRLSTMSRILNNITTTSSPLSSSSSSLHSGLFSLHISTPITSLISPNNVTNGPQPPLPPPLPLLGSQYQTPWQQLSSLILPPLCHASQLSSLLYSTTNRKKQQHRRRLICSGALLTGPPSSGKTTLARHCALIASLHLPRLRLLSLSCTTLITKLVGESETSLKRLFAQARSCRPCVLILENLEGIAGVRGNDCTTEGTMDRLLSTLLIEMDGVSSSIDDEIDEEDSGNDSGSVAVIGITNDDKWIDPALLRPGRLERVILLEYPNYEGRKEILKARMSHIDVMEDNDAMLERMVKRTDGKSAADIIKICEEAMVVAVKKMKTMMTEMKDGEEGKDVIVRYEHFEEALEFWERGR